MIDYLTLADVLAIHEDQLTRYGGDAGVRDLGLLEAALFRPQTGYYEDLIAQASALWESLAQNHPFVDGNKRVGFVVGVLFLELHGYAFTAPQALATHAVLDLAAGRSGLEGYERFLRDHAQPARDP